ncbi:hypothetical protein A1Q2_01960 [Trichosporon asahii var. asahii CBS 8904]|uniref:Uncharacterized protein n=1 Tax=Trichosporon asahii var. asahii (strain CBS 8904) TaxID=1220162 RepID=K1WRX1_TRIAC|nr:hypothetical protein A1Q2_01960 [Trichosporon asahii var. asahii CBS 8904]
MASNALPPQRPSPLFSYYAYTISSRDRVHASLLNSYASSSSSASSRTPSSSTSSLPTPGGGGRWKPRTSVPIPPHSASAARRSSLARAQRRALTGKRPAGFAVAHDLADLSDEEAALDEEKASINQFGHRFLMPFGRRMTLGEMETAPSPTPSDPSHRQEEAHAISPSPVPEEEEGAEVDLDADLEDMDASDDGDEGVSGQIEESGEYDSDDVQLMEDMDRSIDSAGGSDMEEE